MAAYWQSVIDMNQHQKHRFTAKVIECLFNTVSGKNICILGFAFKKNTGDTRESAAIYVSKTLLDEGASIQIYDPKVDEAQVYEDLKYEGATSDQLKNHVKVFQDAYSATKDCHAVVLCTEWDEFIVSTIDVSFKGVRVFFCVLDLGL